jgi:transcriptional regulator with XRE-family HTH domain
VRYNGHAIRAIRRAHGLSVSELAKDSGIRQPHMSLIEAGKRQPSDPVAYAVARRIGVDDLRAISYEDVPDPIPVPAL